MSDGFRELIQGSGFPEEVMAPQIVSNQGPDPKLDLMTTLLVNGKHSRNGSHKFSTIATTKSILNLFKHSPLKRIPLLTISQALHALGFYTKHS